MSPLLNLLLNKDVTVLAGDGLKVKGRLVNFSVPNGTRKPHKPFTLVLAPKSGGYVLVRSWFGIGMAKRELKK